MCSLETSASNQIQGVIDHPDEQVACSPDPTLPFVSIIIVNYNGGEYLNRCLASIRSQNYQEYEIILVDNASTDGSAEEAGQKFSGINLIRSDQNLGFGQANNLGAQKARGEYLAFLNPDTVVTQDWLLQLILTLEDVLDAGLATPKILLLSMPERINTCGNEIHFTGIPACRGWLSPADTLNKIEDVFSISGAAFVARRSVFEDVGGFDETFFLYAEDNDLSWRVQLAGYRCLYVPTAVVYHEYEAQFHPEKYFYLERNRYQMLLKNFRWRTLLLLLPALLFSEVVTWGYAILQGSDHIAAKLRSYRWILAHRKNILAARQQAQQLRRIADQQLLRRFTYKLSYQQANNAGIATRFSTWVFDPLFALFHWFYLRVVRW